MKNFHELAASTLVFAAPSMYITHITNLVMMSLTTLGPRSSAGLFIFFGLSHPAPLVVEPGAAGEPHVLQLVNASRLFAFGVGKSPNSATSSTNNIKLLFSLFPCFVKNVFLMLFLMAEMASSMLLLRLGSSEQLS